MILLTLEDTTKTKCHFYLNIHKKIIMSKVHMTTFKRSLLQSLGENKTTHKSYGQKTKF
jgi:hypothetical protein